MMLSVSAAQQQLLAAAKPLNDNRLMPLGETLNQVLAKSALAECAAPAFDNSAMDGYALCLADLPDHGELPVADRAAAGQAPAILQPGTAMRIFTGAPIPQGADSVCIQENCEAFSRDGQPWVRFVEVPQTGANIRRAGEDFAEGDKLLATGTRLQPHHLALAGAGGLAELRVCRPLRVAIFSTGNELVEPGIPLQPGQTYDSNRVMLEALIQRLGCEQVISDSLVDDPKSIATALSSAAKRCDLILTSGGVSVGEEDHLRQVVEELGQISLWRVAVKPGKPLAFGSIGKCHYFGLPGNPVSAFVTFALFAAPFIRHLQGERDVLPRALRMKALSDAPAGAREEYLRAHWLADGVEIPPRQGSHLLAGLGQADGLVRRPAGMSITAGDAIDFYPLGSLLP